MIPTPSFVYEWEGEVFIKKKTCKTYENTIKM